MQDSVSKAFRAEVKTSEKIELGKNFLKDFIEWKRKRGESLSSKELEKFQIKDSTSVTDLISELSKEDLGAEANHVNMLVKKKKVRKPQERRKQEAFSNRETSEKKLKSTTSRTVFRTHY